MTLNEQTIFDGLMKAGLEPVKVLQAGSRHIFNIWLPGDDNFRRGRWDGYDIEVEGFVSADAPVVERATGHVHDFQHQKTILRVQGTPKYLLRCQNLVQILRSDLTFAVDSPFMDIHIPGPLPVSTLIAGNLERLINQDRYMLINSANTRCGKTFPTESDAIKAGRDDVYTNMFYIVDLDTRSVIFSQQGPAP